MQDLDSFLYLEQFEDLKMVAKFFLGHDPFYLVQDIGKNLFTMRVLDFEETNSSEIKVIKKLKTLPDSDVFPHIYRIAKLENDGRIYYLLPAGDNQELFPKYFPDTLGYRLKSIKYLTPRDTLLFYRDIIDFIEKLHKLGYSLGQFSTDDWAFCDGHLRLLNWRTVRPFSPKTNIPDEDFASLAAMMYTCATGFIPEKYPAIPEWMPYAGRAATRELVDAGTSSLPSEQVYANLHLILKKYRATYFEKERIRVQRITGTILAIIVALIIYWFVKLYS